MSSRAAVLQAPHRFALVDRAVPVPERGDVVVRVAATAVCHTDLAIYTGEHPGVLYPRVMGHEATGVVESVGADVRRLTAGQRVVIDPIIACGSCDCCRRGQGNLCRNAGPLGRETGRTPAQPLAVRFGADHVVGGDEDAAAAVGRLTGGAGADVVIDTAGGSELLALSMRMLRPGGRLLLYAISHQPVEGFSTFPVYYKELTIYG